MFVQRIFANACNALERTVDSVRVDRIVDGQHGVNLIACPGLVESLIDFAFNFPKANMPIARNVRIPGSRPIQIDRPTRRRYVTYRCDGAEAQREGASFQRTILFGDGTNAA